MIKIPNITITITKHLLFISSYSSCNTQKFALFSLRSVVLGLQTAGDNLYPGQQLEKGHLCHHLYAMKAAEQFSTLKGFRLQVNAALKREQVEMW